MYPFIRHLRARAVAQAIAGTTFCEGCGGICTPECRREAFRERRQEKAQRSGIYRF